MDNQIIQQANIIAKIYARGHKVWMQQYALEHQDLVHECLIRAYKFLNKWEANKAPLSTYLNPYMLGALQDLYREYTVRSMKKGIKTFLNPQYVNLDQVNAIACKKKNAEQEYVDKEMNHTFYYMIQKLPKIQRLVILLYYYEDYTMFQIGQILNVNQSYISQLHKKGLQSIKKYCEAKKIN